MPVWGLTDKPHTHMHTHERYPAAGTLPGGCREQVNSHLPRALDALVAISQFRLLSGDSEEEVSKVSMLLTQI